MKPRAPVEHVGCTLWRRVGERIRRRRVGLGFSNKRLADELGIDLSAYDAYEAGREQIPARMLSQIAELFGVSVLWFFQGITFEEETPEPAASQPRSRPVRSPASTIASPSWTTRCPFLPPLFKSSI